MMGSTVYTTNLVMLFDQHFKNLNSIQILNFCTFSLETSSPVLDLHTLTMQSGEWADTRYVSVLSHSTCNLIPSH